MGGFGVPEGLLVVGIIVLLFGGKKIPELMRGVGEGIRSFKDGINGTANVPGQTAPPPAAPTEASEKK